MNKVTPYQSPLSDPQVYSRAYLGRLRIGVKIAVLCSVVSAIVVVGSLVVWDANYRPEIGPGISNWSPLDDAGWAVACMPFGFIIHSFLPHGWLFWIGFMLSIYGRTRVPYFLSAVAAAIFGAAWAVHFPAMMGI